MKKIALAIFLFAASYSFVFAQQRMNNLSRADSLYNNFEEQKALDAFGRILENNPDNYEALWKTSFLYSRIGNRFEEKEDKKKYFNKAKDFAERALEVDSMDTQSNFVMSVAMGRMALISGARDRVAASRAIKKYVDRAIRYDSTNAGAWHVLGRWNYKIANLNFVERLAANALFGGIPGKASNEKAVDDIHKAIELNPRYVLYYYDLATIYDDMGQDEKAIEICSEGIKRPLLTPDDPKIKQACRELIQKLK